MLLKLKMFNANIRLCFTKIYSAIYSSGYGIYLLLCFYVYMYIYTPNRKDNQLLKSIFEDVAQSGLANHTPRAEHLIAKTLTL